MSWNVYGKRAKRKLKRFPKDSDFRAEFNPDTYELLVDSKLDPLERFEAELHECVHAVVHRISIREVSLPPGVEEILAGGISKWLTENRKIFLKRCAEVERLSNATAKRSTKTK